VIWNMAPVLKEEDEKNENIPKMLCQMDNHLGNKVGFWVVWGFLVVGFFFFLLTTGNLPKLNPVR